MNTTPFLVDESIPLVTLVKGLASVGLTVSGDRRGSLVVTTPEQAAKLRGRDLRAACIDPPPTGIPETCVGAGGAHPESVPNDQAAHRASNPGIEARGATACSSMCCHSFPDDDFAADLRRERSIEDELREDDDRQRAQDINTERRRLGL